MGQLFTAVEAVAAINSMYALDRLTRRNHFGGKPNWERVIEAATEYLNRHRPSIAKMGRKTPSKLVYRAVEDYYKSFGGRMASGVERRAKTEALNFMRASEVLMYPQARVPHVQTQRLLRRYARRVHKNLEVGSP